MGVDAIKSDYKWVLLGRSEELLRTTSLESENNTVAT